MSDDDVSTVLRIYVKQLIIVEMCVSKDIRAL